MKQRTRDLARLAPLVVACLGLSALACSEEDDNPLGFGLVQEVIDGTGPFLVEVESSDLDTYYQATRRSGTRLWCGVQVLPEGQVRAQALLRFELILPEGAEVVEGTLRLGCDDTGDFDNTAATTFEARTIDDGAWIEDGTVDDVASTPFTPQITETLDFCNFDESGGITAELPLPVPLLESWADDGDSNHGIELEPTSSSSFKRFRLDRTVLALTFVADGDTTNANVVPSHSATTYSLDPMLEAEGSGDEPTALVGGAYDYRAIVGFSLGDLPDDASVQRLTLTLRLDSDATFIGTAADTLRLGLHRLVSLPGENLGARPEVSFFTLPEVEHVVMASTDTLVAIDVSAFALEVETGVLLKHLDDFPPLTRIGFYTREAAPELRPRLEVVYTLPARIRL